MFLSLHVPIFLRGLLYYLDGQDILIKLCVPGAKRQTEHVMYYFIAHNFWQTLNPLIFVSSLNFTVMDWQTLVIISLAKLSVLATEEGIW
jgi:hypothetical protein